MEVNHLVNATEIHKWAEKQHARVNFPELIRRLVLATSNPLEIEFRAQEGTDYGGWDGLTKTKRATTFVPDGSTGWELKCSKTPKRFADEDYAKRTQDPSPLIANKSTFIFCSGRRWKGKKKWKEGKLEEDAWGAVRVYDADDIATWLSEAPGVHVWLSLLLGKPIEAVEDVSSWWKNWSSITDPEISTDFLLSGRNKEFEEFRELLAVENGLYTVKSDSTENAISFLAASIEALKVKEGRGFFAKTLVIHEPKSWNYFASQHTPLILISTFNKPSLFKKATDNGHKVIFPVGNDYSLDVDIDVPRLSSSTAQEVLVEEGLPRNRARHLAGLARRSIYAFRRIFSDMYTRVPDWANSENGPELLSIILAGSWNEKNEGDRKFIEELTGQDYIQIKQILLKWRDVPDAPFRFIDPIWKINAKEDAWRLLAKYTTADNISHFIDKSLEVLSEEDPKKKLAEEERPTAELRGVKRRFSNSLRDGIADSLAMLGALGNNPKFKIADNTDTSSYAEKAVNELIKKAFKEPDFWRDISDQLQQLAEAAPDKFLSKIESDLKKDDPSVLVLFEGQKGLLSTNYEYPELLWALEKLAWSPSYFSRVVLILAELDQKAPETEIVNSAYGSLISFFRLGLPQCGVNLEQRFAALERLHKKYPELTWRLLVDLLPSRDSAMMLSGPGSKAVLWRNWSSEAEQPSDEEYFESLQLLTGKIFEIVKTDPTKWVQLIEYLPTFSFNLFSKSVEKINEIAEEVENEEKYHLWNELRKLFNNHRAFADADWAMPETYLKLLPPLLKKLTPEDPIDRNKWLFKFRPTLPIPYKKYSETRKELEKRKIRALNEIVDSYGIDGVLNMSDDIDTHHNLGVLLQKIDLDDNSIEKIIHAICQSENKSKIAFGYLSSAIQNENDEWVNKYLSKEKISGFQEDCLAKILSAYPFNKEKIKHLDTYDAKVQKLYWEKIGTILTDDYELLKASLEKLLEFELPRKALSELAQSSHSSDFSINPEIVCKVLHEAIRTPEEKDSYQISSYDAYELLKYLRENPESDKALLQQLEWEYLPLLGYLHGELYLHECIELDPSFFVGLVEAKHGNNNDEEEDEEEIKAKWLRADHLLRTWKNLPGYNSQTNSIDSDYLTSWIKKAISGLQEKELEAPGLSYIGKALHWGPKEKNNSWPHPAVCELIEELANDYLDEGFEIEIYNSRGTTWRGPYEGGIQEIKLAEKYESYAKNLEAMYPRVASILRKIAKTYRSEAEWNDNRADLNEDDLG